MRCPGCLYHTTNLYLYFLHDGYLYLSIDNAHFLLQRQLEMLSWNVQSFLVLAECVATHELAKLTHFCRSLDVHASNFMKNNPYDIVWLNTIQTKTVTHLANRCTSIYHYLRYIKRRKQ